MSTPEELPKPSNNRAKRALLWLWRSVVCNYWFRVVVFAALGVYLGEKLHDNDYWIRTRYDIYRRLQNLPSRRAHPQRTALVLIGDEEFWKGELQGRRPVNREYISRIVDRARVANASTIALDFDFRSPSPDGNPIDYSQFSGETEKLKQAISKASAEGKNVVLTETIRQVDEEYHYAPTSDVYDPINPTWANANVTTGYHVLADDTRCLPPALKTTDGKTIDPFSLVIARSERAAAVDDIADHTEELYAGFLPTSEFDKVTVSASDVLNESKKDEVFPKLANKVVLVSGVWHEFGYQSGPVIRSYDSPVGTIAGVLLHANYFEAIHDGRVFRVWKGWPVRILEFGLAFLVAIPFGFTIKNRRKRVAIIAAPYIFVIAFSYFSLINFGWFFDPFIPVLSVTAHGVLERVLHWREAAKRKAASAPN